MRDIEIESRPMNKQIARIGEMSCVLREELYSHEYLINEEVIIIDILIEREQSDVSLVNEFGNFYHESLQGLFFFIKLQNVSKKIEKNEKLNLQKIVKLLDLKFERGSKDEFLGLGMMRKMAFLISLKIFKNLKKMMQDNP